MSSIKRLGQIVLPTILCVFVLFSCTTEEFAPSPSTDLVELGEPYLGKARVATHISIGSPDACAALGAPQGCDANFSLAVNIDVDGNAKGQYHDQLKGNKGIHASIDCVAFYGGFGEIALISGVVTKGDENGAFVVGDRVSTIAIDGDAENGGGTDIISFSYPEPADFDCNLLTHGYTFLPITAGQVVIKQLN